jgi:hypothetical protein
LIPSQEALARNWISGDRGTGSAPWKQAMSHVYHITPDDLDRFETLESSDVGRPYVLVAGCIHFVDRARTVYLIHLDRPLAHARHYLGSTDDLERRLHEHEQGNGSKMSPAPAPSRRRGAGVAAVARSGIT